MIHDDQAMEPTTADQSNQPTIPEARLREFPPSVKLVLKVLESDGPLTQQELTRETRLPSRTVREAAGRLERAEFVERRVYIPDARQTMYALIAELP